MAWSAQSFRSAKADFGLCQELSPSRPAQSSPLGTSSSPCGARPSGTCDCAQTRLIDHEEVQWCLESPSDIKFVTEVLAWRNHKGNKSPPPDLPADFEGCRPWLPNLWSFVIIEDWMRSADDTCQKFNRSSIN
ncbi:hypothetical protein PSTG_06236 [Puccinia striiformis f. sp. tritici PST-78]|uniref:Uncharacterized protein n=1 Tax=Puccinia striiformis f. sp. tritici PST-78 TaxID=1165861 RepID=A0A0L0VMP3_9BASI|nr:hypothetical protein PSTG_06236 [Puccinia striiformis f. sp. tritici PST-78]